MALVVACVEGLVPFYCHEKDQLCRGFVAASNLRGAPKNRADKRHAKAAAIVAEVIAQAIAFGKAADGAQR
jgi:hypothetical protein